MKFQTTIVRVQRELAVDAGHKVNDAVEHAREADDMEAKSIVVVTPPAATPMSFRPLPVREISTRSSTGTSSRARTPRR